MAKFSSIYKQTAPTRRTVNGENTYEKGMMWSNQALMPGYTRTLLNFEIDMMTGALTIPGGFHVNTIAAGCTYIDKLYYPDGTHTEVVVTQPRNEYFLRAFEGITNILSVQKLNAKDILQQVSNAPQYLNSVDNVNCYKIITYNPFNHRTMVITLLQAANSSFVLNKDLTVYRLNANPISAGFSEVWQYAGEPYISNQTDLFPQGVEDTYTVRPRRIKLNETFGKPLYHDYHMHSVPHTEGFGNKTFIFTQKQVTLGTTEEDESVVKDITTKVFSNPQIVGSEGYSVRDIIFFKPLLEPPELYNDALYPEGDRIQYLKIQVISVSGTGVIQDYKVLSPGRFIRTTFWADGDISLTPINDEGVTGSITSASTINNMSENFSAQDILNLMNSDSLNPFKNNKYIGNHTSSGKSNITAKDDDKYFGLLLTGLGIRTKLHNEDSDLLLNTASVDSDFYPENPSVNYGILHVALINHLKQSEQLLKLNLSSGIIMGNDSTEELDLFITPVLKRTESNTYLNQNITDLSKLFKQHTFDGDKEIFLPDFLTDNIKRNLQIGQSIRIAAYCKVDIPLPQSHILNNLRTDVDESNYYRKKTPEYEAVFLLEYVWDGLKWNFTFVDTEYKPDAQPYFMTNWDATSLLYSPSSPWLYRETPKLVISTEVKTNHLSYLDIVTEDNKAQMCATKDSSYSADLKRIGVADLETKAIITAFDNGERILDLNLDETLNDVINTGAIQNTLKKFNNTQYAHFKLIPKELTPAMAARWGYNMLSPTPYTFICQNTPGLSASLTGVLLMRGNQPLLTPRVNTPGELYIYYNADFNNIAQVTPQRYQISVEYKNIYDEWRSLKEYSVAESHDLLSSGKPITLPFSSPDEIVLIKVSILDRETVVDVAISDGTTEEHFLVVSSLITTLGFEKNATQTGITPEIYDLGTALGLTYWKGRLVCWGVEKANNMLFLSEPNEPEYFAYPNGIDVFEEDIKHVINYSDSLIVFTSTKLWRIDMSLDGLTWTKSLLQQNIRISDNDIPYIVIIKSMLFFKSDKQFFMLVPQRGAVAGELTIAPISKAIIDFLKAPFDNLMELYRTTFPGIAPKEHPEPTELPTNPADEVEYPTSTTGLTVSDNILYGKGTADLSEYLSIPNTVERVIWFTEIADNIPTVYVPSSVKKFAMSNSGIQNIYFKEGLEELVNLNNNNLTAVYIPKTVEIVQSSTFSNNPNLEKIVWDSQAFMNYLGNNIGLKELYLPSDIPVKINNSASPGVFDGSPHTIKVYAPIQTHEYYLNDDVWKHWISQGKVILKDISKDSVNKLKTPFDYLVKYGAHVEQNKVFVDWWFDITSWKYQSHKPSDQTIVHDYQGREYWLIQLIYDTQTYSWSIQTHSTSSIGYFVDDAANSNTDFVSLILSPHFYITRVGLPNYNLFQNSSPSYGLYDSDSYGVSISNRKTTEEKLLNNFNLNLDQQVTPFEPTYPRFQIFDTGYKEVSTPALKKHFREIQFTFEPRGAAQVEPDGDAVGIRAVLLAQIDGQTVMSAVSQEITEELQEGVLIIKVVDKINYQDIQLTTPSIVPLPYLMDSELSNTFVLESSALSGVKNVKVRRAINGKGQLIRMRFVNITESNYAIISHAFVSHNKNAR